MRRSFKDRADKAKRQDPRGYRKGYLTGVSFKEFTRMARQRGRSRAKKDLIRGREPQPIYPVERLRFD